MTKVGFFIFVAVVPGMLLVAAIFDLRQSQEKEPPLGHYLQVFILEHRWVAAVLAAVYGAMLAHFFLNIAHG